MNKDKFNSQSDSIESRTERLSDVSDTTRIIKFNKLQRQNDKIGFKIWGVLIVFISVLSSFRITVIGQFIDDIFFTFPFGWFKYIVYLLFFIVSFAVFCGVQIKVKRRAQIMFLLLVLSLCWSTNDLVLMIKFRHVVLQSTDEWGSWFLMIISDYAKNWKKNSLFNQPLDILNFFHMLKGTYLTPWAGGGFIGTLFSAIMGYITTLFSFMLSLFTITTILLWIFTGNPWYIFQWKIKTSQRKLKIESFDNNSQRIVRKGKVNDHFESFDSQVIHSIKDNSDITIQLPVGIENTNFLSEDLFDDIYQKKKTKQKFQTNNSSWNSIEPKINLSEKINYSSSNKDNETLLNEINVDFSLNSSEDLSYDYSANTLETPFTPPIMGQPINDINEVRKNFNENTYLTPFSKQSITLKKKVSSIKNTNNQTRTIVFGDDDFTSSLEEVLETIEQEKLSDEVFFDDDNFVTKNIDVSDDSSYTTPVTNYFPIFINPNYKLPPLSLLEKPKSNPNRETNIRFAKENVQKITRLFQQFKIDARVANINIGSSIIKFEIELGEGVKVSKITTLENDIKLVLASNDIRLEAPIHGKSAVGIEIPNPSPTIITLREIMENITDNKQYSSLLVAIGKNVFGKIIFAELDKMPHLLVAGATGSGKSICINTIIASLLLRNKPHELKLLLIDPKRVELSIYNDIPHLLAPVITDLKKANRSLKQLINEMDRRYVIFANVGARNIESYNNKVDIEERLPYIVIIIDELADLMIVAGKEVEESIMRITQMARASGIHLIIATQRPSTDIITGVIKNNIPSRIAFAVSSSIDSRTILDSMGAEKLIGKGDMLFAPYGQITPTRAQGVYISEEETKALIDFVTNQQKPEFKEELTELTEKINSSHIITGEDDELYDEVKDFVINHQKASASLIQRRFGVGYNRAARLMDSLEVNNIVGPANGSKPREVLIKK